jgi:IclR family acetate operon transcriptional repressor
MCFFGDQVMAAGTSVKTDTGADPVRERTGVQSLERAFSILTHIAKCEDGINLADLSKLVGLHTSTAFHLVRTMVELGVVRQDRRTKRYHLGRKIFSLAANASSEIDLVATATPFLETLAQKTGESSHLGLRSGNDVVLAARVAGSGAFQLVERAGGLRPAHCTGLGKVLMASLPEPQFESWLQNAPLTASTPNTITEPGHLRSEIERVRQTGVAFDDAEYDPEVRCIAAPVWDFTGQVVGAVGVSGPIWRMNLQRMNELALVIRESASELSQELGYVPLKS